MTRSYDLSSINTRDVTRDLRRRIAARYGRSSNEAMVPEYSVLFEVPVDGAYRWTLTNEDGHTETTSRRCRRRIDAVAVGLWRRTDYAIHGFEIKATRADLLAELRDPDKSEPGRRLCDRWWLVLKDRSLLGDSVLPDGWGLLVASGRGLRKVVDASSITGERDPRFIAALVQTALRSHGTCAGMARVDGHISGYKRGLAVGEERKRRRQMLDALRSEVS